MPAPATLIEEKKPDANYQIKPQETKELSTEFQKFITSVEPLQLAFYCTFAGWREVTERDSGTILGVKIMQLNKAFKSDENIRLMNDDGANFLYHSILPLISHVTTTGKLSEMDIYNLWNGKLTSLEFKLLDSYYLPPIVDGVKRPDLQNPYQLKSGDIGDIITSLAILYAITKKAEKGFTLTELAESFATASIYNHSPQQQPKGGIGHAIGSFFNRGK